MKVIVLVNEELLRDEKGNTNFEKIGHGVYKSVLTDQEIRISPMDLLQEVTVEDLTSMVHRPMDRLHLATLIWAEERGLNHESGSMEKQFMKVVEELGELSSALLRFNAKLAQGDEEGMEKYWKLAMDSMGDTDVTLSVLCNITGLNRTASWEMAYNEIKDRKGNNKNGTFMKEGD